MYRVDRDRKQKRDLILSYSCNIVFCDLRSQPFDHDSFGRKNIAEIMGVSNYVLKHKGHACMSFSEVHVLSFVMVEFSIIRS